MSSSVENTFATILEWIMKIIVVGVLVWLVMKGLGEFDAATFHKRFAEFSGQMNRRSPEMLQHTKTRLDSTFYTNRVFYIDMTVSDSVKKDIPILDIHSEMRDKLSAYTGPDDFGKSAVNYKVDLTYRFVDKDGFPVTNKDISHKDYYR